MLHHGAAIHHCSPDRGACKNRLDVLLDAGGEAIGTADRPVRAQLLSYHRDVQCPGTKKIRLCHSDGVLVMLGADSPEVDGLAMVGGDVGREIVWNVLLTQS